MLGTEKRKRKRETYLACSLNGTLRSGSFICLGSGEDSAGCITNMEKSGKGIGRILKGLCKIGSPRNSPHEASIHPF